MYFNNRIVGTLFAFKLCHRLPHDGSCLTADALVVVAVIQGPKNMPPQFAGALLDRVWLEDRGDQGGSWNHIVPKRHGNCWRISNLDQSIGVNFQFNTKCKNFAFTKNMSRRK